ncbi:hypothetical protein DENSPDRAFT_310504 [Dentipellis sp. KUC8613]|nr:hypothetical protein DENSPDRAFT_310504 [Dentipellis sp. KUC8613]
MSTPSPPSRAVTRRCTAATSPALPPYAPCHHRLPRAAITRPCTHAPVFAPSSAFARYHGFYLATSHVASPLFSPVAAPSRAMLPRLAPCRAVSHQAVSSSRRAAPSWRHTAPCCLWAGPSRAAACPCHCFRAAAVPSCAQVPRSCAFSTASRRCCTVPSRPAVAPALSTPSMPLHAVTLPPRAPRHHRTPSRRRHYVPSCRRDPPLPS